jgi:CheY-like chemotaxis protein
MPGEASMPPQLRHVLLVDDNDRYAKAIGDHLRRRGTVVERVHSAAEGLEALRKRANDFDGVITDITMETQISGLRILARARRLGFEGLLVTASTGLDSPVGYLINRFILGTLYGCDYLIPKRPIKRRGKVAWIRS